MNESLPDQIVVKRLGDGVRYELGSRNLGIARLAGVVPMIFGCVFVGFAVFWMMGAAEGMKGDDLFGPRLLFVLFGVPFVIAGLVPIFIGLFIMFGRGSVEVRSGRLRYVERAGPLWWRSSRPVEAIETLMVKSRSDRLKEAGLPSQLDRSGLIARGQGIKDMTFLNGYPVELLTPLAHQLAEDVEARGSQRSQLFSSNDSDDREVQVQRVEEDAMGYQTPTDYQIPKPTSSNISMTTNEGGATWTVPPVGIWRGSKGLFFFAILWNGFIAIFTLIVLFAIIQDKPMTTDSGEALHPALALLFLLPFIGVGVGVMLAAINMGRRRAIIDVVDGTALLVTRQSIFGTKQKEWLGSDLDTVQLAPSGMTVNDRRVMELQIQPKVGKTYGMLSERDDDEIRWLAWEIREALGMNLRQ